MAAGKQSQAVYKAVGKQGRAGGIAVGIVHRVGRIAADSRDIAESVGTRRLAVEIAADSRVRAAGEADNRIVSEAAVQKFGVADCFADAQAAIVDPIAGTQMQFVGPVSYPFADTRAAIVDPVVDVQLVLADLHFPQA